MIVYALFVELGVKIYFGLKSCTFSDVDNLLLSACYVCPRLSQNHPPNTEPFDWLSAESQKMSINILMTDSQTKKDMLSPARNSYRLLP